MPTVTREIAERIISNDGFYEDDPRVVKVVEYTNAWGGLAYGLVYEGNKDVYTASAWIINPKTIFEVKE